MTLGLLVTGVVLVVATLLAGGARLEHPTIDSWLHNEGTAIHSPRLGTALRGRLARRSRREALE